MHACSARLQTLRQIDRWQDLMERFGTVYVEMALPCAVGGQLKFRFIKFASMLVQYRWMWSKSASYGTFGRFL